MKALAAEVAAMSQVAFGLQSFPPNGKILYQLNRSLRISLWGFKKKRMYSWPLCKALVLKTHRIDPWSAICHEHLKWFLHGIRQSNCDELREMIMLPMRVKCRGPLQHTLMILQQLGFVQDAVDPWFFVLEEHGGYSLLTCDVQEFLHVVREAMKRRLLQEALTSKHVRPDIVGCDQADIVTTTQVLHAQHPLKSALICLIANGMWTGHRLAHTEHRESAVCLHCGHDREDTQHVLWDCPKWNNLRRAIPNQLRLRLLDLP
eukprot:6340794-Amphidinium_carterae.1